VQAKVAHKSGFNLSLGAPRWLALIVTINMFFMCSNFLIIFYNEYFLVPSNGWS
jgi:hypothetical protein